MKKLTTTTFLLIIFLCLTQWSFAQQPSAQQHLIGEGYTVQGVSPNGKYVTGFMGFGGNSFRWSKDGGLEGLDERSGGSLAIEVSDNGIVTGQFADSTYMYERDDFEGGKELVPLLSAGYYKDDKWHSLGIKPGTDPISEESASDSRGISTDGTIIGGAMKDETSTRWEPTIWTNGIPQILEYEPIGQGTIINDISGDGSIPVGWGAPYSQRVPVYWKQGQLKYFEVNGMYYTGECQAISPNGRFIGVTIEGDAALYDVQNDKLTIIGKLNGTDNAAIRGVSDNGIVVGYCRIIFERLQFAYIYHEQFGIMYFGQYLELLGIEAEEETNYDDASGISADGSVISFKGYTATKDYAWVLEVAEQPKGLNPAQRLNVTETEYGKMTLTWDEPSADLTNTLTGYNIYREGIKIADVPASQLFYEDDELANGIYTYHVKAVWNNTTESLPTNEVTRSTAKVSLPFYDSFITNDLESNYWGTQFTYKDLWKISFNGINPPGLQFVTPIGGNYSDYIVTPLIDAKNSERVFLSYNYAGGYAEVPGTDSLKVEGYDGTEWHLIKEYVAGNNFAEFTFEKFDISEWAANKEIRIRFTGYGSNGGSLVQWEFDNIRVYSAEDEITEDAPINLNASRNDDGTVTLTWVEPDGYVKLSYLEFEDIQSTIGNLGTPMIVANKLDVNELKGFDGYKLTEISAYLTTLILEDQPTFRLVAFRDTERIMEQEISSFVPNSWNTFILNTPVTIDASKPLYYGIEVVYHNENDRVIGVSGTPEIDGKSNIFSEDGGLTWEKLTDWEIFASNSLKATLIKDESSKPKMGIYGYQLYRDNLQINLQYGDMTTLQIATDNEAPEEACCYKVVALYITQEESGKSQEACVGDFNSIENENYSNSISVYPNPVTNYINISGEFTNADLFNISGQLILTSVDNKINVQNIPAGIYILKITSVGGDNFSYQIIKR